MRASAKVCGVGWMTVMATMMAQMISHGSGVGARVSFMVSWRHQQSTEAAKASGMIVVVHYARGINVATHEDPPLNTALGAILISMLAL